MTTVLQPARAATQPDWPCAQPLVPSLTAGSYWDKPIPAAASGWRSDTKIADVVAAATPRDVPVADAVAKVSAFADSVPASDRPAMLGELFQGLVDAINDERGHIIARIESLAARQRDLSHIATQLAAEARDAPPGQPATIELDQRRDFATRAFQEAQRTMRYACEAPTDLESRLGQLARVLQDRLGG